MVFADCPGSPAPSIVFDVSATIAEAVTHLIDHGHRRIGLISPPATFPNMRPIIESHRKTLLDAGLPCDDDLVPEVTDFSLESGGRALEALTSTSNPATAAITAADDLALGGIRAARRMGIVIPRNFALIGFGETPYASLAEPPLTTVTLPVSDLGATAMTMMRRMIAGDPGDAHTVSLPSHLTIRRSCGSHK